MMRTKASKVMRDFYATIHSLIQRMNKKPTLFPKKVQMMRKEVVSKKMKVYGQNIWEAIIWFIGLMERYSLLEYLITLRMYYQVSIFTIIQSMSFYRQALSQLWERLNIRWEFKKPSIQTSSNTIWVFISKTVKKVFTKAITNPPRFYAHILVITSTWQTKLGIKLRGRLNPYLAISLSLRNSSFQKVKSTL